MAYPTTIDSFTTKVDGVDTIAASHINDLQAALVAIETELAISTNRPKFAAYNSATDADQTGAGTAATVDFDTELFDTGNNLLADVFTAPVTGQYLLCGAVFVTGMSAAMTTGVVSLVTSNRTWYGTDIATGLAAASYQFRFAVIADMNAGHTAYVQIKLSNGAGDTADVYGGATNPATYFCGAKLP